MRYENELLNCSGLVNGTLFMVKTARHVFWRPSNRHRMIKLVFSASCHLIVDGRLKPRHKKISQLLFLRVESSKAIAWASGSAWNRFKYLTTQEKIAAAEITKKNRFNWHSFSSHGIDGDDLRHILCVRASENRRVRCLTLIHCSGNNFSANQLHTRWPNTK